MNKYIALIRFESGKTEKAIAEEDFKVTPETLSNSKKSMPKALKTLVEICHKYDITGDKALECLVADYIRMYGKIKK